MGFFRNFGSNDDDILWFLILFLLLFWNGCGCNNRCGCNRNTLGTSDDCGCNN